MQPIEIGHRRTPVVSRTTDRTITAAGIGIAAAFLLAAVAAMFLPEPVRHGYWLPLHLTLAGAATTAIAAVLPFFTTSLLAARPAPAAARVLAVSLVAAGAVGVATGVAAGESGAGTSLAAGGGTLFVAGVVATAWTAFRPLRGSLGPRHRLVLAAYAAALGDVAIGATLATLYVGGYGPVLAAWAALKPVHAWLNLLGFVSLLIAGTLLHLYPTVLGTRIPARRSAAGAAAYALVALLVVGPPAVAAGYWLQVALLVQAGALAEVGGAAALLTYASLSVRARGRWTTDRGWHRATIWHLSAGIGWFAIAAIVVAALAVPVGAGGAGWSGQAIAVPFAAGFVAQSVIGGWTHLIPSIGPGDPVAHGRQRKILGRLATPRVVAYQIAIAVLWTGVAANERTLATAGALALAAVALVELALVARAAQEGRLTLVGGLNDAVQRR